MDNKKFSTVFIPRASFYLWVILVLVAVIGVLNWLIAIPGLVLLIALVYYHFRSNYRRKHEITRYIENLMFNIDTATKDTLLNFPMPLVVIQLDGTIIWYNSSFRKIFEGKDLLEKTIGSFAEGLQSDYLLNGEPNISKNITINNKSYNVLGNIVKTDHKNENDEYILLLYFIENTELVELKKRYEDEKTSVCIIIIDNYDDLMQSMEGAMQPQVLAEIDKKLVEWVGSTGGILKKYERDKYLFVFEKAHLKGFIDKKFDILDSVKEINTGNKIPVTLSMGFGINGSSFLESFNFAAASIDIALGRGGDQVVIKDGEKFSFYGGKTRELEKRTRVKARVIAYALREFIDQSPLVLIMGHEKADVDSLGASLGLYRIVKERGKNAHIVLNEVNSSIKNIMSKIEQDQAYDGVFISGDTAMEIVDNNTLLIVVDTYRPGFTECPELLKQTSQVVVIDHHRKGADFIQDAVLTYQEIYASSTCELVTEILQYVGDKIKLRPIEAEALYSGIVVDTKNFTFKTGVRTFDAASFLKRQGVDTISVKQLFQNDLETYINISNVVMAADIIDDRIAISVCPPDMKDAQLIAAKSADQLLTLTGIAAAFVLCHANGEVAISGRSLGDINVQMILEKLGGGGHLSVAGAQLQGISMEDAVEKLKYAIIEYINESNNEKQ